LPETKPIKKMKKHVIEALVAGIIYCIGLLVIDAKPGHEFQSVGFYIISSVIFGVLFTLAMRLIQKWIGKRNNKA